MRPTASETRVVPASDRPDSPAPERRLPPGARASRTFAQPSDEPSRAVKIVVDVHEQRSGILEGLEALGARVALARLPAGDYAVGRGIVVERKRVLNLHAAVLEGKFWPQLGRLRAGCRGAYLLIEGTDIDRGPLHPASVRSLCLAVIDQGVPVLRSYQQRDSAIWLYRLALRAHSTGRPPDRPPYAQRPVTRTAASAAEALLASIPGISTTSARALLARFGSVAGVVAAGPAGWLEVDGIGPTRVSSLEEALCANVPAADLPTTRATRPAAATASRGRRGGRA
jgi:DNA excision repair protein ERCC-4